MIKTVNAIFDGKVLRPEEPVDLEPDTHVRIVIEIIGTVKTKKSSFYRLLARSG